MRFFLFFVVGFVTLSWAGEMGQVQPVRLGKKFGYVDGSGELVVRARWDWAWPLTEGRAGVREGRNWYLLNEDFQRVGRERYDWVGPFSGGLAPAREGKLWGLIDRNGGWVVKPYFSDVRPLRGGGGGGPVGGATEYRG